MDDRVKPIRVGITPSQGKQDFLDTFSQIYDSCNQRHGEPVAMVLAVSALDGGVSTGYHTIKDAERPTALYIARCVGVLHMDLAHWDGEAE